jgi:hypothetical protein
MRAQDKANAMIDDWIQSKRINMSRFIQAPVPTDTDARLLRVVGAATIFSATEKDFA